MRMMIRCKGLLLWILFASLSCFGSPSVGADSKFDLNKRLRTSDDENWVRIIWQPEKWPAAQSAVIICDMWDAHHCLNAVRRVQQLAPRIDKLVQTARNKGAVIIHAPSSCMDFYKNHPARLRAMAVPRSAKLPNDIESWCHWKNDCEQSIGYPIDASDGGEDDDLEEHVRWHEQLAAIGRNPKSPWIRQIDTIGVQDTDYITDNGAETWSILEHHHVHHVMLVGVHTNMCVLGRPFGLRQLSRNGKNVVLVRDLTDTMYNPAMPPYVNHFSGTDLIIEHIEQHVCPTITSNQILGGAPLRLRRDQRPHIVMMIGEQEYKTRVTLPAFAKQQLYQDYRVSYVFADPDDIHYFHDTAQIVDADLLVVSVRRRSPPAEQLALVRQHIEQGKPVVGVRTASHAFSLGNGQPATGRSSWPDFDAEVFGGSYHGHHGNKGSDDERTFVWREANQSAGSILDGIDLDTEKVTTSWLYKTSPLHPGTRVLLMGRVGDRKPHEPVSWTYIHRGGGRSFYTSLGHPDDFDDPNFVKMLKNAMDWCLAPQSTPTFAPPTRTSVK